MLPVHSGLAALSFLLLISVPAAAAEPSATVAEPSAPSEDKKTASETSKTEAEQDPTLPYLQRAEAAKTEASTTSDAGYKAALVQLSERLRGVAQLLSTVLQKEADATLAEEQLLQLEKQKVEALSLLEQTAARRSRALARLQKLGLNPEPVASPEAVAEQEPGAQPAPGASEQDESAQAVAPAEATR